MKITIWMVAVGFLGMACSNELYEGSECILENGKKGICKKVIECAKRLEEVIQGNREAESPERCGFEGKMEIVCCPILLRQKIGLRLTELACQQYENEIAPNRGLTFHILGGTEAASGEFPYAAALGFVVQDGLTGFKIDYSCGGSLISPDWVLTAAHCVNNLDRKIPSRVRLGSDNLESSDVKVQEITIDYIIPHPNFKRAGVYHDIALIKLATSAKWSATVRPICLTNKPINYYNVPRDSSLVVVGWGATDINARSSKQLMKTPSLNIVTNRDCNASYMGFSSVRYGITDDIICVIDGNTSRRADACQGDSGGPLVLKTDGSDILAGVTSSGQICGSSVPAIYTSVFAYVDWIESFVWPDHDPI